ncbi:O-methyltransferase [Mycolicibacterium bacteremicum]|uniref:Methyltransferase n=1 Tax=Mycolicibacterium bacteremicum TaxID=564198 RepID=A0A1W9Z3S0_MYCBA|nr:O-methyltransferase [Mycolicibacterium bacteremicum]MCV7432617.1 O-methyltransferase [Mycolicibacterium bacteremicum]ORA06955.1 methyltransferase [Mycolicibacterium bacteremicum]
MTDPAAVDALFDDLLGTEDEALRAARASTGPAGMPAIEVSPQHGRLLTLYARLAGARRVLEIGTLAGYSTICLARGVGPEGSVVTCEYEPRHAEVARQNLERAGVADRVQVIVGPALDTLGTLQGPFDLFFIDADKENNPAYVEAAVALAEPGALIIVDNIARGGRVLDPAPDDRQAIAVRDTIALLGTHPRLDAAAIQTVGAKGWDGFAVALVS